MPNAPQALSNTSADAEYTARAGRYLRQRGCGMPGFTFAQNPYSLPASSSQNDTGRSSVKVKRVIDLIDLIGLIELL